MAIADIMCLQHEHQKNMQDYSIDLISLKQRQKYEMKENDRFYNFFSYQMKKKN